jgi:putative transposase
MEAADEKRLKNLEEENRKLKMMVADLSLDNHAFKEVFRFKALTPDQKHDFVKQLQGMGLASVRLAKRCNFHTQA